MSDQLKKILGNLQASVTDLSKEIENMIGDVQKELKQDPSLANTLGKQLKEVSKQMKSVNNDIRSVNKMA